MQEAIIQFLQVLGSFFVALVPVLVLWQRMKKMQKYEVSTDMASVVKANTEFRNELREDLERYKNDINRLAEALRKREDLHRNCEQKFTKMQAEFAEFRVYCKMNHQQVS